MFRKTVPFGGFFFPNFSLESSESYRVFNYFHDSNSIFRAAGIHSEGVSGRTASAAAAKLCFFAVLNGTSMPDPESVSCSCDPDNWAHGRYTPEASTKDIISSRISFSPRAAIIQLLDWLPRCVAQDFCNPEDPDALGADSSFLAVTQQQLRACIRRMLRRDARLLQSKEPSRALRIASVQATLLSGSQTSRTSFRSCRRSQIHWRQTSIEESGIRARLAIHGFVA